MTIISKPSGIELCGNLSRFLIASTESISFILKKGDQVLLEQIYDPGTAGQVEIDVKDIVEANLSYILQEASAIYEQTAIVATFTAIIDAETVTFTVIRAGVDRFADTAANFLTANFLTWQQQIKKVTYYSPEFLSYYAVLDSVVKIEAHYADNTTEMLDFGTLLAGKAYTIPLQYALINSLLTKKLPSYYDVYIASADGVRYSYIQRFIGANKLSEDEQWFLFENTLGGIDTIRAYGQTEFTGEHTHNLAEIDEVSEEYRVDTLRKFKKNTGYLDTYERRWLLDFFPSKKKYIYENSTIRQIVVSDSDVNFTSKTLPSAYNFTYKYAAFKPLLNLTRSDSLPAEVTLSAPVVAAFTMPPRLIDFPHNALTGGALVPFQEPYSESWGVVTIDGLYQYIKNLLASVYVTGDYATEAIDLVLNNHIASNLHLTQKQRDALELLEKDSNGRLKINADLYSTGGVSAYGPGSTESTGGATSLGQLVNVAPSADDADDAPQELVKEGSTWKKKLYDHIRKAICDGNGLPTETNTG
ncbi:MAG: hypothetical protein WC212_08110, partial [Candidatus Delongbacteria bacterium]